VPLNREQIVVTALALVDQDGLKALSMRRLGAALGVDPMAVYYHVPSKDALLDAIVEAVMAEIDLAVVKPADSPEQRILCAAIAYRDVMLAHRNAMPIMLTRGPATAAARKPVELLVSVLHQAGLPLDQAVAGMNTIAAAVRGMVGMAAPSNSPAQGPKNLKGVEVCPCETGHEPGDFLERDFEFGVQALARGLLAPAP
jgi:AcrR family transcriptional regulator